jgi:vitamin B12 transporter
MRCIHELLKALLLTALLTALPAFSCPFMAAQESGAEADDGDDSYLDFGADARGVTLIETPETTQQMEVIEKEEIERRSAPDLATLLEETLDMGITRYGAYGNQTEINIRGFDTERIAILIDGVPANSPRSGEFDVSSVNLADVERIEVVYGGSDTKYSVSGALGGVINIITKKRNKKGFLAGGSFSNIGYVPGRYNEKGGAIVDAEWGDLLDMQSLSLFAEYGAEGFYLKGSWFGAVAGNHYNYQDYAGFARRKISNEVKDTGAAADLSLSLPSLATLRFTTDFYYADRKYPVTGTSAGYAVYHEGSVKEDVYFHAPAIFRDDLETEATISWTWKKSEYGVLSESRDNYLTAINRWNFYLNDRWTLRSGADWRSILVDSSDIGYDGFRDAHNGGLYLTGEFAPVEKLLFIASVKGATDTKQAVAVPKAGLAWHVTDFFTLKNNYFRSFKFPDFDDLYYRSTDQLYVGNPDLQPEDGLGADLAGELGLNDYFAMSAAFYAQWTTDSIHWVKEGPRWHPENIGTAFFIGLDWRPEITVPVGILGIEKIMITPTYQFQLNWLLNEGLGFSDFYRIPYMPTHIAGASLDIPWKTGSVLVSVHWESSRYADPNNLMVLDPYCLVNLTVNQDIGNHVAVFGVVRNMLNALYTSFAEYPMPGMSVTLGVRTKFGKQE